MYFVVLFLESFHSGVCKNNVGVLLVQSWVSLWAWTHGPVEHCTIIFAAFYGHWTQILLFTRVPPTLSEGLTQLHWHLSKSLHRLQWWPGSSPLRNDDLSLGHHLQLPKQECVPLPPHSAMSTRAQIGPCDYSSTSALPRPFLHH